MAEVLLRSTRDRALADAMGEEILAVRDALARRLEVSAAQGDTRSDVSPEVLATIVGAVLDGLLLQQMADPSIDPAAVASGLHRLLTRRE